jgi:hypothetical protein
MQSANVNPFGNPDGSRAAIDEILDGFVSFGNEAVWGGLAMSSEDRTVRVIVGRKGSGKTVYLRRLQAYADREASLYADDIQQSLPQTESVVNFCQQFPPEILTEKWIELWRCAILASAITHILYHRDLRDKVSPETAETLKKDYSTILPSGYRTPVSAYSQVTRIIDSNRTYNAINAHLNNDAWNQVEWLLGDELARFPPLCFYIDAVDEDFENAPMYWLRCQLGLFYAVMRMLRDTRLGGRLHITICIRDIVLAAVLRSEHKTRYIREPHIRVLKWNLPAIAHFLNQKISGLPIDYFMGNVEAKGKTLASWLGRDLIRNTPRKIEEPVQQYLLRHTRLIPRDVITLGNALCEAVAQFKYFGKKNWDEVVRKVVHDNARIFGDEQLEICSKQISSDTMPSGAGRHRFSEVYTGGSEYQMGVSAEMKQLIAAIGKDRFSRRELDAGRKIAAELFGSDCDPFAALWQNGLLGYVTKIRKAERQIFFTEERMDEFQLPIDRDQYVFHSCVIDSTGIKSIGKQPVIVASAVQ